MRTQDINRKASRYMDLQAQIKALKAEADGIAAELKECGTVTTNRYSVKVDEYGSTRIDSKRLRREMPELAELYSYTAKAVRLTVSAA